MATTPRLKEGIPQDLLGQYQGRVVDVPDFGNMSITKLNGIPEPKTWDELSLMFPKAGDVIETAKQEGLTPDQAYTHIKSYIAARSALGDIPKTVILEKFGINNDTLRQYMAYKQKATGSAIKRLTGKTPSQIAEVAFYADYYHVPERVVEANFEDFRLRYQSEPEWLKQIKMPDATGILISSQADESRLQRKDYAIVQSVHNDPSFQEYKDFVNSNKGLRLWASFTNGSATTFGKLLQAVGRIPGLQWDKLYEIGKEMEVMGDYLGPEGQASYLEKIVQSFGSTAPFILAGLAVSGIISVAGIGGAITTDTLAGKLMSWLLSMSGASASAASEALIDARDIYNRVYNATGDKTRALHAGVSAFFMEGIPTAALEKVTIFNPEIGSILKRFVAGGAGESLQEVWQNHAQRLAETGHFWDKDDWKADLSTIAVTFPVGGVFGIATGTSVKEFSKNLQKMGIDEKTADTIAKATLTPEEVQVEPEVKEEVTQEVSPLTEQEEASGLDKVREVAEKVSTGEATHEEIAKAAEEIKLTETEISQIGDLADLLQYKGEINESTVKENLKKYLSGEEEIAPELKAIFDLQIFGKTTPELENMLVGDLEKVTKGRLKQRVKSLQDPKQRLEAVKQFLARQDMEKSLKNISRIESQAEKIYKGAEGGINPYIVYVVRHLGVLRKGVNAETAVKVVKYAAEQFNAKGYRTKDGAPVRLNADELISLVTKPKEQLTYGDILKYEKTLKRLSKVGHEIALSIDEEIAAKVDLALQTAIYSASLSKPVMEKVIGDILKKRNMSWRDLVKALNIPSVQTKKDIMSYFSDKAKSVSMGKTLEMTNKLGEALKIDNFIDYVVQTSEKHQIAKKKKAASVASFFKNLPSRGIGFHRIVDLIAGTHSGQRTPLHDILVHAPAEGFNAYLSGRAKRTAALAQEARKAFGKNWSKNLNKEIKITAKVNGVEETHTFTKERLLGIYAASKTSGGLKALENGNDIPLEIIQKAIFILPQKEKQFVDDRIAEMHAVHAKMVDAVFERTGRVLPLESYYFRLQREMLGPEYSDINMDDFLGLKFEREQTIHDKRQSVEMNRIEGGENQRPINIDFFDVMASTIEVQERILNLSGPIRMAKELIGNKKFRQSVGGRFGEGVLEALDTYVDLMSSPFKIYRGSAVSRFIRGIRHMRVFSVLAGNVKSILNQFPSILLVFNYATTQGVAGGALRVLTNPISAYREAMAKSKVLRNRTFAFEAQEMKELTKLRSGAKGHATETIFLLGMIPQRAADIMTTTVAWHIVYQSEILNGTSEQDAIRKADDMIRNTQPMPWVITQNLLMTEQGIAGEMLRGAMAFTGQQRQLFNILAIDVNNAFRRGDYSEALLALMGVMASQAAIAFLAYKGLDEPKKWLHAIFTKTLGIVPLLGRLFDLAIEQAYYRSFIFGLQDTITDVVGVFEGALDQDAEKFVKSLINTLSSFGPIPVVAGKRYMKFLETGEWSSLTGVKNVPAK